MGSRAALELARAAAGDKNIGVWGGANIMRQYLKAGLLDEMQIHLIPILLGGGVRLFEDLDPAGIELRRTRSIETPSATHLRFSVVKENTYRRPFHEFQVRWNPIRREIGPAKCGRKNVNRAAQTRLGVRYGDWEDFLMCSILPRNGASSAMSWIAALLVSCH